jgi:hypothetical protein
LINIDTVLSFWKYKREMLVATLACTPSNTTPSNAANILQQVHDLQRLQDAAAADIGGEFGDLNPADSK